MNKGVCNSDNNGTIIISNNLCSIIRPCMLPWLIIV